MLSESHSVPLGAVLFVTQVAYAFFSVHGVVRDSSGAPVQDAEIVMATPERASVATARSDSEGRFQLDVPIPGRYLVTVLSPGFKEVRQAVTVLESGTKPIEIVLSVAGFEEDVTVTASPGVVQDVRTAGQPVNVIAAQEILERVDTVVAEAVTEEAGVQLQRTSPTMAGVFVRGLTGNKVNVFVDGIRYSNGAQRGGVNTFLDLIEPGTLESIEILRGPSSAQYGSDALGGSIQFLTRVPSLSATGPPDGADPLAVGRTGHRTAAPKRSTSYAGGLSWTDGESRRTEDRDAADRPGFDSHAAVTRFFGVRSDVLMDERLPSTSFGQISRLRPAHWAASDRTRVIGSYARTNQDGGERYDQLLGGDGNLISELNDLLARLRVAARRAPRRPCRLHVAHLFAEQPARRARQPGRATATPPRRSGTSPSGPRCTASRASWQQVSHARDDHRWRRPLPGAHHLRVVQRESGHGRGVAAAARVPDQATFHQEERSPDHATSSPIGCACSARCAMAECRIARARPIVRSSASQPLWPTTR
jgi:hypothetical protein